MDLHNRSSTTLGRPSHGFDDGTTFEVNEMQENLTATHDATSKKRSSRQYPDEEIAAPSSTPGPNPADFPDGGMEVWMVILGGWCCLFVSFGWIVAIGVFQDYYQGHQLSSYSASTISWIPSLQACSMFIGAPMFGKLFDNYGPHWLLAGGTFFHVFGLMMASISSGYYQLLLSQGLCSSLGAGAIFYAANNSGSTWFSRRRAFALGVMSSGSSLGGVIFP